jgi:non-specific serine/threonine protein kinase
MPDSFQASVIHIDALPSGTLLAEFEILGLLGVGGFGMVYRAYDHSLHRTVAIKEYMPAAIVGRAVGTSLTIRSSVDQSSFSAGLKSFVAEARLLARFDHPSLVKVYRFWEANNTAYMAMPLYIGVTLKQARSQMQSPPSEVWLRKVLWSVLEALKVLHENNTLHRDISPDNIFLQDVGPPVLLDLGSARREVLDTSQKHTAVLKVNYAPIEQYADSVDLVQGPWTDLYSVAAVVHGCLCNDPPLPATFRVIRDRMPKIAHVARTVAEHFGQSYSTEFVAALNHALSIQPDARPRSVDAFVVEMRLDRPDEILKFDWRADLADTHCLSDGRQVQLAERSQPVIVTIADQQTAAQTAVVKTARSSRPSDRRKKMEWMALIAVLVASGWFILSKQREPKVAEAVVAPIATGNPVPGQSQTSAEKSVVADVQAAPARVTASAAVRQVHAKQPRPSPAPSAKKAPVVLCADSNFITRSMCVYLECQKPQFAHLAACVENRNRYPDNRERINR